MNKMILIAIITICLSGCSFMTTGYQFPTSMAIEYKDNEYVVSIVIPSLEETSNAITENKNTLSIVRSSGKTISQALGRIELKEKGKISATHIKSVIFHKSLFEEGNVSFETLCDYFIETTELRLDTYIYLTEEKIDDILSLSNSLSTVAFNTINDPTIMDVYNKFNVYSFIDLMVNYFENRSIYIPSLIINKDLISSKEDELKEESTYLVDDMCFLSTSYSEFKCINKENLSGLTYFQEKKQFNLEYGEENEIVSGIVKKTKSKVSYDKTKATMEVNLTLELIDNMPDSSLDEIKQNIEEKVKKEIIDTYNIASSSSIDVYQIKDGYKRYKKRNISLMDNPLEVDVSIKILGQNSL